MFYEITRHYFLTDDEDSEVDNESLLATTRAADVTRLLKRLPGEQRAQCEVITHEVDPRDHLAYALHPGDPELGRQSGEEWLAKHS